MSHNGELLAARDEAASRRGFVLAVRGYDKRQVDQYVSQVDSAIATLAAERERALGHIQELNARLQQVQMELAEARDRPTRMDRASFRHLGPMVDQILALAEKQAEQIISTTSQRAANRQAEADKVLSDAEEKAAKTLRELDEELDARRTAEQKAHEERLAAAAAELAETRKLADRLRAEGEADHERAEQEAQRIKEQSAQQVERVRAESEALLEAAHARAEQEVAQRRADVEREIVDRRTEAAQKIAALHAQAQHHCAEVRRRGDEQ
ncbi:MAG TPA: hypothetical protein VFM54_03705, partial [Micromonosporaceae bacterium]|nr:hypothetical protein [Micromonosporaceae bacterium]